ncbi:MAG: NUDIX hydrolase [Aestuariibaculum sp.]
MNFNDFLKTVPKIKNITLPAETSHFKMVPPFRQEELKQYTQAKKTAKEAAVLALFYPDKENRTRFILILRKTYNGVHSAQIGFPGGKVETEDLSLKDTAIRETFEEIGVSVTNIKVVQALTEVYIPPSHFNVFPFLGICPQTPTFTKQDDEVEDIIEVDLTELLDDSSVVNKKRSTSYSQAVTVPAFFLKNQIVWGATAMMLSEIKDLLKLAFKV